MKPENDKELHNDLNISALPHPIAEGKEKDYTYSLHLAKLLRRFVRLAAPDYDQITLSDVELLDALMSYGTIEKVALTDENITLSRRQAIASARNKSMAVEAHLREHKHN